MRRGLSAIVACVLMAVAFFPALIQPTASETSEALPFYSLAQYPLPAGSTGPSQIASDKSGRIWFVEQGSNQIGGFNPGSKSFSEFQIPTQDALPEGIAVDPAGDVWFTELTPNGLGALSPENGTIKEVTIPPAPDGIACGPIGVTPQGNGSIWVTCEFSNQIDEYVPSLGILKQFDLPVAFSAPLQVVFDRSGNFWFTAADSGMLGYATINQLRPGTTDGIEEFAPVNSTYRNSIVNPLLPTGHVLTSLAVPSQIAFSPDGGSIWVTEHGAGSFDRYDIVSKTLTKYFTTRPSSSLYTQALPNGIAVDSSGLVWVAEHYGNRIAEFDPATGSMEEYPVPCCRGEIAGTLYLATGTNGTVWFTENLGNAIGELSPVGTPVPFSITPQPAAITLGTSGSAGVSLTVSLTGGGTGTLSFGAEGVSRDGTLVNLTAAFHPGTLTPGGTGGPATLSLTSSGLASGIYYITVGATSSSTGEISSAVLAVTVSQESPYPWAVAAVVITLVAVGLAVIAVRLRSGRKRHGASVLQKRRVTLLVRQE